MYWLMLSPYLSFPKKHLSHLSRLTKSAKFFRLTFYDNSNGFHFNVKPLSLLLE